MSSGTYFVQGCPTCGRRLQIRVEHLSKTVVCQHCRAQFTASDPAGRRTGDEDTAQALLRRADLLLERSSRPESTAWLAHPR
jgi:hypothetical protein